MIGELMKLYIAGGNWMHLITVTSLLGIAIIVERFMVLTAAANIKKDEVLNHINSYILQGNLEKAIAVTSQVKNPLTNIVRAGLMAVANNGGPDEVQTAMDAVALREVPRLERRVGLLATLSNIATLLGLLGTVAGLIGAFGAVANVAPAEKATMLANAIATAMNTTAFGLIVAIPLLGCFGFLNAMVQGIVDDVHEASVATLNFVLTNREKLRHSRG
ncbi:MAG: MotA/TolQ/ExbB proton channel family protein [Bdellovibrionaceae bacterium]|nr:MotA/TolQ/ExbB proton channel family protein [Bdellovibrionales bacterium]MCB9083579.1 MotA/TolQ/ExbB proton channel family protein [Pseudobdellovibrionaceae bacterium]